MICFECKEKHTRRKPPSNTATTCQTVACDYCHAVAVCFPDYKVLLPEVMKQELTQQGETESEDIKALKIIADHIDRKKNQ